MQGMPPSTEIITDGEALTDPNPWRNYRRCLSDPPAGATHLVILQDDVVVCRNFAQAVERLVAVRPDDVLSLFVGGVARTGAMRMLEAAKAGRSWVPMYYVGSPEVAHVVSVVWPVALAAEFLAWTEVAKIPSYKGVPRSDDAVFGAWLRLTRRTCWACVPSLVEHPDDVPTLIHDRERARGGADRGRVAVMWIGPDRDPLENDWLI